MYDNIMFVDFPEYRKTITQICSIDKKFSVDQVIIAFMTYTINLAIKK